MDATAAAPAAATPVPPASASSTSSMSSVLSPPSPSISSQLVLAPCKTAKHARRRRLGAGILSICRAFSLQVGHLIHLAVLLVDTNAVCMPRIQFMQVTTWQHGQPMGT